MAQSDVPQVKQTIEVAPPESQFSLNWQMIDGFGGNVQVTMRASLLPEWPSVFEVRKAFCEKAQQAGWSFPGTVKPATPAPVAAKPANGHTPAQAAPVTRPPAPAQQPAADMQTFQAETLAGSLYEGKPSWKVKGGQFSKFGVTIWPEALADAGLLVDLDKQPYSLAGYTAYYVTKTDGSGKPQKVVRLVAPVSEPF